MDNELFGALLKLFLFNIKKILNYYQKLNLKEYLKIRIFLNLQI